MKTLQSLNLLSSLSLAIVLCTHIGFSRAHTTISLANTQKSDRYHICFIIMNKQYGLSRRRRRRRSARLLVVSVLSRFLLPAWQRSRVPRADARSVAGSSARRSGVWLAAIAYQRGSIRQDMKGTDEIIDTISYYRLL